MPTKLVFEQVQLRCRQPRARSASSTASSRTTPIRVTSKTAGRTARPTRTRSSAGSSRRIKSIAQFRLASDLDSSSERLVLHREGDAFFFAPLILCRTSASGIVAALHSETGEGLSEGKWSRPRWASSQLRASPSGRSVSADAAEEIEVLAPGGACRAWRYGRGRRRAASPGRIVERVNEVVVGLDSSRSTDRPRASSSSATWSSRSISPAIEVAASLEASCR